MVHNNKILTVSYGTFSCTLEGFEDSFGTMKAIAEYFRDLAADDRYFGAEPPVPDAEMLARIAQREISRKVEAHEDDGGGIVLRAKDLHKAQAALPAAADTAESHATTEKATEAEPEAEAETVIETKIEVEIDVEDVPTEPVADSAEKPAEPKEQVASGSAPILAEEDAAELPAPAAAPSLAEAMAKDAPIAEPIAEAEPIDQNAPAADSIAAKLQRIRAVVSRNETAAQTDDYVEDEEINDFVTTVAEEMTDALNEDDEAEIAAQTDKGDEQVLEALKRLDAAFEPEAEEIEPLSDALSQTADQDTSLMDAFAQDYSEMPAGDFEDDLTELASGELPEGIIEKSDDDLDDELTDEALFADIDQADLDGIDSEDIANILSGDDETPLAPDVGKGDDIVEDSIHAARPRVIKVKRADFEAALMAGDLEEVDNDDAQDIASLSPESEEELRQELAEVEAELEAGAAEDDLTGTLQVSGDLEADDEDPFHASLPDEDDVEAEDVSRLMAAADEKMGEPETSSSRETYNQLRAAVAATEAERSAGGQMGEDAPDDVYREDLASVVRPRRPVAGGNRPERPATETRPAPLKLVAEQRVDTDGENTQRGPVRPRRVATSPIEDSAGSGETEGTFAEFASEMGASELPELLEAAAAYLSFVEGRAQFSRPQLMNKVRQIDSSNYNREDGLRSFGRLLREGKIEKTGGGRFTASGDIGFRPDERAAG